MSNKITLNQFTGEEEILEKIKGLKVKNIEHIEYRNSYKAGIHFSFIDEKTKEEFYMSFDDEGIWHFGEKQDECQMLISNLENKMSDFSVSISDLRRHLGVQ